MGLADCPICSGNIARKDTDLFCVNCGFIVNSPALDKPDSAFEMSADKVKKLIDADRKIVLLDVRDDEERAFSKIEPSVHINLRNLAKNWFALDNRDLIITYCHQGNRCLLAAKFLQQKGYTAKALTGGIDNWSRTIDKTVPRYNKTTERGKLKVVSSGN